MKKKKKKKNFFKAVINYIKEEYKFLILCFLIAVICLYKLPYNIYPGGGIININDRVTVVDGYKSEGSFNMAYVDEIRATIPTYLLSYIFNWDREPIEESLIDENDTPEDSWKRNRLYLEDSNDCALISAFNLANEKINIISNEVVIIYISPEAKTDLEIGDVVKSIDDYAINSDKDMINYVINKNVGEKVSIKVIRDDKEITCYANIIELDNTPKIGISMYTRFKYETDREVEFNFKRNEAGPSAGLMLALEIYNQLVSEDITKGYKIAGTGTIDKDGNVGSIGGVKYKVSGANSKKAKVFFVPVENYEEAMKAKNENNYEIEIVQVSTLSDAVDYLRGMK